MYSALCVFSVCMQTITFMYSALCVFSVCMQTITTTREALERVGVVVVQPVCLPTLVHVPQV